MPDLLASVSGLYFFAFFLKGCFMKSISALMAGLMVFSIGLTTLADHADAGHRSRRNAAVGVALGAAALAVIAASKNARADEEYRPRRNSWRNRCMRLLDRCNDGSNWACEKYETGGCTE